MNMPLPEEIQKALQIIKMKKEERKSKKGKKTVVKRIQKTIRCKYKNKSDKENKSDKKIRKYSKRHCKEYYQSVEDRVLEMYRKGIPYRVIAETLSVSESFVYKVLKRRNALRYKRGQYYHITSRDLKYLIKLYRWKISRKDIDKLGNYYYRIYRNLIKLNIPPPSELSVKKRKQIIEILKKYIKENPDERLNLDELQRLTHELNQVARRV